MGDHGHDGGRAEKGIQQSHLAVQCRPPHGAVEEMGDSLDHIPLPPATHNERDQYYMCISIKNKNVTEFIVVTTSNPSIHQNLVKGVNATIFCFYGGQDINL